MSRVHSAVGFATLLVGGVWGWRRLLARVGVMLGIVGPGTEERGTLLAQTLELLLELIELPVIHVLQIHQSRASALDRSNKFIELELHGSGIAVLGVLDEKDHQEGDDGCA